MKTFALYRYSPYFWNEIYEDRACPTCLDSDLMDAIGEYIAKH